MQKEYTYLALGDSYTIGEQVPLSQSFPYQALQILRRKNFQFHAPEILAVTGWTSGELNNAADNYSFRGSYDFVSLLIGVNNQYRGLEIAAFDLEFETLLKKALAFAENNPAHVFVLSIPDWGVTPFAEGRDKNAIAEAIDQFNNSCKNIAESYNIVFIDITESQREDAVKEEYLAADKLHPSGKEYTKWALKLSDAMIKSITGS